METKILEIRDEGTCIPVLCIQMASTDLIQHYYLRRAGYPEDGSSIMVMFLSNGKATNDPYEWQDLKQGARTMPNAHHYILDHWYDLEDGDVVDVQHILGETSEPKVSERLTVR